ncbi:unnamed protein product [Pylaiella littoralis]
MCKYQSAEIETLTGMQGSVKWLDLVAGGANLDDGAEDGKRVSPTADASANRGRRVSPTAAGSAVVEEFQPKPLNLVTIWGAARTGKSFFLNALTGVDNLFRVSRAVTPCTSGADLSRTLFSVSDLEKEDYTTSTASSASIQSTSSGETPLVGFVDMEGQGDKDSSHDVLLATPLLLLSKIMIFNWKGMPNKMTMLENLAIMTNAAREVNRHQRKNAFGHLVVLLRDVPDESAEAHDRIFGTEDAGGAESDDEEKSIKMRNSTREDLSKVFQSIQVLCLPSPHSNISAMDGINLTELNSDFLEKIAEVRGVVAKHLATSHNFGGEEIVGGGFLSTLMADVCKQVTKRGKDIAPPSIIISVKTQRLDALRTTAEKTFKSKIAEFEDRSPTSECAGDGLKSRAETKAFLTEAELGVMENFDKDAQGLGELAEKARMTLEEDIKKHSNDCVFRQQHEVAQLKSKVLQHGQTAKDAVDTELRALRKRMPMRENGELSDAFQTICTNVHKTFDENISKLMPSSLREDLSLPIPNAEEFKAFFEAEFTDVTDYNKTLIKAEDSVGEERELLLAALEQQQKQFEERSEAETRRFEEMQRNHELLFSPLRPGVRYRSGDRHPNLHLHFERGLEEAAILMCRKLLS